MNYRGNFEKHREPQDQVLMRCKNFVTFRSRKTKYSRSVKGKKVFRDIDEGLLKFYSNTKILRHSKIRGIYDTIRDKAK